MLIFDKYDNRGYILTNYINIYTHKLLTYFDILLCLGPGKRAAPIYTYIYIYIWARGHFGAPCKCICQQINHLTSALQRLLQRNHH